MSVQRISSFKSFTEVKNQQASIKMHEENKTKRDQLLAKIGQTLEEMGVTSLDELDEEKRTALVAKIFNEDRAEDIEAAKVKMGEPKKHEDEEGKAVQSTNESLITEATRSQIGKIDKAGKITSVYVHWDGSPDTRVPLLKNYKDVKTLDKLLDLGKYGISSLEKKIGDKPQDFNNPERGITVFYGRDRDEKNDMTMKSDVKSIAKYLKDAGNHSSAEYVYLFDERDGKWYMADVYDDKELKPVKESVEINEDIHIHDVLSDLMNKLQVKIGNLLFAAKGDPDWTRELNNIKKSFETLEDKISIANKKLGVIFGIMKESVVSEALFGSKDLDKTLVTYATDMKADEIYIISVSKVIDSFFPDLSKVEDKRFRAAFGMMLEADWLKQYDKLPKVGDILPAPKKDKAFESIVTEAVSDEQKLVVNFLNKIAKEFDYSVKDAAGFVMYTITKLKLNESAEVEEIDEMNEAGTIWSKWGKSEPMGLSKAETKKVAELYAAAISKKDGVKCTVNQGSLSEDSFDLDIDGEKWAGGSYNIYDDGQVVNMAVKSGVSYGKYNDSVDTIVKNLKALKESVELNEARSINKIQNEWTKVTADMKSTVDSWKKAEGDAKAPLLAKLKELTAKKNALESELNDAISDKDKDLELVVSEGNAFVYAAAKAKQDGKKEFEFNGKTYKVKITDTGLSEEVEVNESSEYVGWIEYKEGKKLVDTFKDQSAAEKWNKANVDKLLDDEKVEKVGIMPKSTWDKEEAKYAIKESAINEEDITSDEQFKEYAFKVLKQAFEADFDETKAQEVVDGILKVAKGNYGDAIGMLTSSLG